MGCRRWCLLLLWCVGGLAHAELPMHRYLPTLVSQHGLLDLVRSKSFFTPLTKALGAVAEDVGNLDSAALLQSLMAKPAYRAYASVYAMLETRLLHIQGVAEILEDWDSYDLFEALYDTIPIASLEQMPIMMALDSDMDFDMLEKTLHHAIISSKIPILLFSGLESAIIETGVEEIMRIKEISFPHHGSYVLRSNRIVKRPPTIQQEICLQLLGWEIEQIQMMTRDFADTIYFAELSPEIFSSVVNGLDLAVVIDLMTEGGVFDDIVLSLSQVARLSRFGDRSIKKMLGREMLLDPASDDFEEQFAAAVALLNDPDNPATLAQLVKLIKLEYSLDDIKALHYGGRDAIIVSNALDKEDFEEQFGVLTMDEINNIVDEIGPLFFYLRGLGIAAEKINPHHPRLLPVQSY